jgi:predicted RNase H-like nuclease (RuvC/YqgF family)
MVDEEKELTGELEEDRDQLAGLRQEKDALQRELAMKEATVAELEQASLARDGEIAILKQALAEAEQKLAEIGETLAQAVDSYRQLATEAHPEIPAEMITGDTIVALERSLQNACVLVEKVKQEVEAEASRARVPAGAPPRAPLDLSALSPREKIQFAIGGKR